MNVVLCGLNSFQTDAWHLNQSSLLYGSTWFNMVQQTITIVYGDFDCYMVIIVINGWLLNLIDYYGNTLDV